MTDEDGLPDEIALLWGLREAPKRGRKPSLTVADITRAAIEVADAEGLAAVSMARVAQQLDKSTMALYRHVNSKDELLALMADAALESPPELPAGDWRAGLTTWTRAVVGAFRRHPWFALIPLAGPPVGPHNLAWFDSALGALADEPVGEAEKVGIVMGLLTFVHGELRLGVELSRVHRENPDAFSRSYSRALRVVVDPRRMPALGRVVAAGVFDADDLYVREEVDADFGFALDLYLDGVAAHLARRSGTTG
ncbi:TetR/AcrR family transcriptional regulator [Saccharothrix sp. Mg75]|uniref:TetR/AcrR family transcriptional regulator n=1 Tax=Saccharothrix sp. Mg75 TaxID=3445357 RepID=UPI003EED508C